MNTKKILLLYIVLTLLIPMISFTASADGQVMFSLTPSSDTVTVGEQFNITVCVDTSSNVINTLAINNLTFTTDYADVSLQYGTNVSYWLNSDGYFDYTQDLVRLDGNLSESGGYISNAIWSVNEENATSGSGYMFNITFNATSPGTVYINLTDTGASYADIANTTDVSANSTITIISGSGTVTTNASANVTYTSATLNGYLEDDGGETCNVTFQLGLTDSYGMPLYSKYLRSDWSYNLTFTENIWNHNTSISINDTVSNFLIQGGIFDNCSKVYRYNKTSGLWNSWIKSLWEIGFYDLVYMDNFEDYPQYEYQFKLDSADYLNFTFDIPSYATSGDEYSLNISGLIPGTTYHYRAKANNSVGVFYGSDMTFTTTNLSFFGETPSDSSTNVPINTTTEVNVTIEDELGSHFNWTIISDVGSNYSGDDTNGSKSATISTLSNATEYDWTVHVYTSDYVFITTEYYSFTTTEHPYQPNTPNPSNNSNGNSVSSIVTWSGGDPDGDDVNYTIFFGDSSPPSLASSNQSGLSYDPPGSLNYSDDYYWRVIAYDDKGANITGPIWNFSTVGEGPTPEDVGNITINETLGIGTTNATLTGFVINHSDPDATVPCGFVCGPVTENTITDYTFNESYTGGNVANMSGYAQEVIGLTSAKYYYARAWMQLDEGFNISAEGYFLTKPSPPTNLDASLSGNDMYITWDVASVGSGTNLTTIVRYSNSSQPATMFEGDSAYNGTSDHCLVADLDTNTLYNFSAFSFINSSGSPLLFQVSDTYDSVSSTSFSGQYNISLRWENTTHQLVNTTLGVYHRFIVHYTDRTEVNLFNSTGCIPSQETNGNWTLATSGEWNISCPSEPLFFEFCWNDTHENPYVTEGDLSSKNEYATVFNHSANTTNNLTYTPDEIVSVYVYNSTASYPRWVEIPGDAYTLTVNQVEINSSVMDSNTTMSRVDYYYYVTDTYVQTDYRCNRKIVPISGQENITFYILTDKPVYGEASSYMNHSIVKYTYSFLDETALYRPPNDPIAEFYIYDIDGNKLMIHSEYFDSSLKVRPWLYYGKNYFVGVSCNKDSIARIGIAPTGDDTASDIRIPYEYSRMYSFFDLIDLDLGWSATGMYVNYTDTTDSTTSATFYVYNYTSGALLHSELTGLSSYNFTYACNTSIPYKCNIIATLDDVNDLYDGTYQVGGGACWIMLPDQTWINTNVSNINYILTVLFGKSPLYDGDYPDEASDVDGNYLHTVGWTYIALFSIAFILFVSFGKLNGFVGTLAAGLFILASGAFIEGLISTIAGVGMFIIVVGIIGLIGGIDRK